MVKSDLETTNRSGDTYRKRIGKDKKECIQERIISTRNIGRRIRGLWFLYMNDSYSFGVFSFFPDLSSTNSCLSHVSFLLFYTVFLRP